MKNIKSFNCISTAKYALAFNTLIFILFFPIAAIIAFNNLDSTDVSAFILNYLFTYLFSGILGGTITGYLFGLTYNILSPYIGAIEAELETDLD